MALSQQRVEARSPTVVPNLISHTGILRDDSRRLVVGISTVTFLLYAESEGGLPLWLETQSVTSDESGYYQVQLGATSPGGFPTRLLTGGGVHWLAVQLSGQSEQARVMLVAVPYAVKAKDADTIGGLDPSAFVRVNSRATWNESGASISPRAGRAATITGITAGIALTGGGNTGNVTLNLDTNKIPQLNTANTFVGNQSVAGNVIATGQIQGGPAGLLLEDGGGQTIQLISRASPLNATPGTAQFIPSSGTVAGMEAYSVGLISGSTGDFYCHHGLVGGGTGICYFADVANDAGHLANSFSQSVQFDSVSPAGADIFTSMRANPQNALEISSGGSPGTGFGAIRLVPTMFARLPPCGSSTEGTTAAVTDSMSSGWGGTVVGGGVNHVLAYCDGYSWTVAAK